MLIAFEVGDSHKSWNVKQYAGNAVANGMPWLEAIKAITLNPARIYGMDKGVGSLDRPGRTRTSWCGAAIRWRSRRFADAVFIRGQARP